MGNKNDFISDNLITIRDRLRESTAAIRENSGRATEKIPVPPPAPDSAAAKRMADGLRAKQDLAERIARDSARLTQQQSAADQLSGLRRKLQNDLQQLQEKLQQLNPAELQGNFARETDRLRMEYFRICGALEAMEQSGARTEEQNSASGASHEIAITPAVWILAGAILAGAALVAGVTAAIFL